LSEITDSQWSDSPGHPGLWMALIVSLMVTFNAVSDCYNYAYFLALDPRPCIAKFAPLMARLPHWVKIGYITDEDLTQDHGKFVLKAHPAAIEGMIPKAEFVAIQYSLVPHVLVHQFNPEFLVGNFHHTNTKKISINKWRVVQNLGNGVLLWKKSS
jgi:hypothetical protein